MGQNITNFSATGTYSDSSKKDITNTTTWSVSDSSIASINAANGQITIQPAGQIWGGTIGTTASLSPGTPGTASLIVVASDSGSIAPRMPLSDIQWQVLGLSPWGSYWGLQEPSGTIAVSSGSTIISLTGTTAAGAGVGPQQGSTEPNWLRNFVVTTGSAAMSMNFAAGNGPGVKNSIAFLTYCRLGQMGSQGPCVGVIRFNSLNVIAINHDTFNNNTGMLSAEFNAQFKRLTGPLTPTVHDRVHPMLVVVNTSSFTTLAATDISIITSASDAGSWQFTADGNAKGFGSQNSSSYGYFAIATGSVAESMSDPATAGAFLQKLGWNVPWATCPTDSGSIKLPFLPFHWTSLGIQPWTAAWNMQETVGTSFASNDSWPGKSFTGMNMTLSTIDALQYNPAGGWTQGWTRGAVLTTAANQHFARCTGGPIGPFDATGSFAILIYSAISGAPASNVSRTLITMGPASTSPGAIASAVSVSTGTMALYCGGSCVTGSVIMNDSAVHPFMLVYDQTNSRVKLYTDKQALTGTFTQLAPVTSATGSFYIGGTTFPWTQTAVSGVHLYAAMVTGTLAESYSTDGVASNFLKTLGWTVSW